MTAIIKPLSWFDMVTPDRQDMDTFLRAYIGADHWRMPRRLWRRMHHSKAGILIAENRIPKLRKYQKGTFNMAPPGTTAAGVAAGTIPQLNGVTMTESNVAPTAARVHLWYDSDGGMGLHASSALNPTYTALTTQSDDANDHTNNWWPDQPETNIGLDYDIRYTNNNSSGTVTARYLFRTAGSVDRTVDVWYVLDDVSNDGGDGTTNGCLGVNRNNGIAKSPSTGNGNTDVDPEIRATGSGSALASHAVFLQAIGT